MKTKLKIVYVAGPNENLTDLFIKKFRFFDQKRQISQIDFKSKLIWFLQGNRTTPSYVAFTDTERLIGDAAKNQVALNPNNTVSFFRLVY